VIINLRGTHGSGKSHTILGLLEKGKAKPIRGQLGIRKPEAYELKLPGVPKPVYVLGPYTNKCGGCDAIQPYDIILELIERYAAKGHVIFEGALVSSSYGRVGRLMEKWGQEAVMAFMALPIEDCLGNVRTRRAARGDERVLDPHNTESKFKQVTNSREKIRAEGKLRVVDVPPKQGIPVVLALLKEAE
jgi:hypothetical protein